MNYNLEKIEKNISGKVYFFEKIDSTNKAALSCDAPDKSVFLAKTQIRGRGRLGRIWESSGDGIYMTILLKPTFNIEKMSALTLATGLAVAKAIDKSTIKWPNDIVIGRKKVAGILAESSISEKTAVAIGIGVNVNNTNFSEELSDKATSIFLETGKKQDMTELVIKILNEFFELYDKFINGGFESIKNEYKERSATLGKDIMIIKNDIEIFGRALDITDNGELVAEIDGKTQILNSGEVSVRGLLGYN